MKILAAAALAWVITDSPYYGFMVALLAYIVSEIAAEVRERRAK